MAIVSMVDPFSPGSRLIGSQTSTDDGLPVSRLIGLTDSYIGACIADREANGYNDSDFYMTVWDDAEGKCKSICYASTRGWSYPCMASAVDATPETLAKVAAWRARQERDHKAAAICGVRTTAGQIAAALGISRKRAFRLMAGCAGQRWQLGAIRKLLTAKLRSDFKIKLRTQVQAWLAADAPRYPAPLSPRQMACLDPMAFSQAPRGGYMANTRTSMNQPDRDVDLYRKFAD